MYFGIQQMHTWELPPFEFYDKMLLKSNYKDLGVRAVPSGTLWRIPYKECCAYAKVM